MAESIVVDASAWLAVLLTEENSDLVEAHLVHGHLLAPELIRYETANGILYAERRGRLTKGPTRDELFKMILNFPIQMIPLEAWWDRGIHLAQKHDLTFYDAAYVGVARALGIPMLTLDDKVRKVLKIEKLESVL
jgi:predicted nucleic acid-binding protein